MTANNPEAVSAALSDILKQNNLCYRMISNDVMLIQAVRRENILAKKFRDIEIRDVETTGSTRKAYEWLLANGGLSFNSNFWEGIKKSRKKRNINECP